MAREGLLPEAFVGKAPGSAHHRDDGGGLGECDHADRHGVRRQWLLPSIAALFVVAPGVHPVVDLCLCGSVGALKRIGEFRSARAAPVLLAGALVASRVPPRLHSSNCWHWPGRFSIRKVKESGCEPRLGHEEAISGPQRSS